jgi:hypothetical protein
MNTDADNEFLLSAAIRVHLWQILFSAPLPFNSSFASLDLSQPKRRLKPAIHDKLTTKKRNRRVYRRLVHKWFQIQLFAKHLQNDEEQNCPAESTAK